jgi:hypothetical protein
MSTEPHEPLKTTVLRKRDSKISTALEPDAPPGKLTRVDEPDVQTQAAYWLGERSQTIGRDARNAIQVNTNGVSREHARVFCDSGGWLIEDLGSRNGVWVNRVRIQSAKRLHNGDEIHISQVAFRLELTPPPPQAVPIPDAVSNLRPDPISDSTLIPQWNREPDKAPDPAGNIPGHIPDATLDTYRVSVDAERRLAAGGQPNAEPLILNTDAIRAGVLATVRTRASSDPEATQREEQAENSPRVAQPQNAPPQEAPEDASEITGPIDCESNLDTDLNAGTNSGAHLNQQPPGLEAQAEAIAHMLVRKALEGDPVALQLAVDRLWPQPKGTPSRSAPADTLLARVQTLVHAFERGQMSPAQAQASIERLLSYQR